jgi:hypothetical protein
MDMAACCEQYDLKSKDIFTIDFRIFFLIL